jgi:hypothetical protein
MGASLAQTHSPTLAYLLPFFEFSERCNPACMWLEPFGEDNILLESGILSRLLILILPISRNRAPRELLAVLEGRRSRGRQRGGGGRRRRRRERRKRDLLITGGSHARSCEFCFVSAWSDSLSTRIGSCFRTINRVACPGIWRMFLFIFTTNNTSKIKFCPELMIFKILI